MEDWLRDMMSNSPIPLWGWVVINLILWGTVITIVVKYGGILLRTVLTFFLPYWTD